MDSEHQMDSGGYFKPLPINHRLSVDCHGNNDTMDDDLSMIMDNVSIDSIAMKSLPQASSAKRDTLLHGKNDSIDDDLSIIMDNVSIDSIAMKSLPQASSTKRDTLVHGNEYELVHEGEYAVIFYHRNLDSKLVSHTGSIAIKSIKEDLLDDENVHRLENEYSISRHLSDCPATRAALRQTELNGVAAIVLEWIPGITLGKVLKSVHKEGMLPPLNSSSIPNLICQRDLKLMLQLACQISKAISCIHDAGVVLNNLIPDNIIVNGIENTEYISIKIIGLGSASLLKDTKKPDLAKMKDIASLGYILFQIFTGRRPFEDDTEKLLSQNLLISLLTARVPLVLAKLTFRLIGLGRESSRISCYKSARDVGKELNKTMNGLEGILSNPKNQACLGRLQVPQGKLYGRDSHLQKLLNVCNKVGIPNCSKIILVSGNSGAGKSALVEHAKEIIVIENNVHFITGKFDQLQQSEPLSAIGAAFTEYSNDIIQQGPRRILEARTAIAEAIKADIGVLTDVFPCLCGIIGKPPAAPTEICSMAAKHRFKFIFQMFVRVITTPSRPIILFLDDLQWADELSLQLISTLVTDTELNNFLFIGSYRSNEAVTAQNLTNHIKELEAKHVGISYINVSSLSSEDVSELVSDSIKTPKYRANSLSDIIYRKTSGNVLLVIQFIRTLWDEGLLYFSLESTMWQWDTTAIKERELPRDAVVLMAGKILQLPIGCQYAIKLLACLGTKCDESTLQLCMGKCEGLCKNLTVEQRRSNGFEENSNSSVLQLAVNEGLLKKEKTNYAFVHDQIQNAAYSLVPENERGQLHKQIGYLILENTHSDQIDDVLFVAVDQLNRAQNVISEEDKRIELAKLNLRAGEKATSLAMFLSAASYFEAGIDMLCDDHWRRYYDVSLQLFSLYAEVEYCNGHFEKVGHVVGVVVKQAKNFEHKLRSYATLIKAVGAQNKHQEAIEICFSVLTDLRVQCQSPLPDKAAVMEDLSKTKTSFEDMTDDEFLRLNEMKNPKIVAAMKFFHLLLFPTYMGKQEYLPVIITQMMKLTMSHGVCKESCIALSSCSFLLGGTDFKGSERVGRLAIMLVEKLKAHEYKSQVYCHIYVVSSWTSHIKLSLEPLINGYQIGMQTGAIEYAMMNLFAYFSHSFVSGRNLVSLGRDIEVYGKQMANYKQAAIDEMALPIREAVSNLTCSTNNRSLQASKEKFLSFLFAIIVAYVFCDYEVAADMIQKRQAMENQMSRPTSYFGTKEFFDGLVFLAMARRSEDKKWIWGAIDQITKLEYFVQMGRCNCEHKLLLLQAESESIAGDKKGALAKYEMAIAIAEKNDFIHEQAIANERLADFLLRNGDSKAAQFYGKAHTLYLQWGAQGKADHLCQNIPF